MLLAQKLCLCSLYHKQNKLTQIYEKDKDIGKLIRAFLIILWSIIAIYKYIAVSLSLW